MDFCNGSLCCYRLTSGALWRVSLLSRSAAPRASRSGVCVDSSKDPHPFLWVLSRLEDGADSASEFKLHSLMAYSHDHMLMHEHMSMVSMGP